jgi:hypothetical protein
VCAIYLDSVVLLIQCCAPQEELYNPTTVASAEVPATPSFRLSVSFSPPLASPLFSEASGQR